MATIKARTGEDIVPKCTLCKGGIRLEDTVLSVTTNYNKAEHYHGECIKKFLDAAPKAKVAAEPKRKNELGLQADLKDMLKI